MKTSAIIRTVLSLSVLLFPMSCAGDDILFFDEELINENNDNPQLQTQTNTTENTSETTTQIDETIPQIEVSGEDDEDNVAVVTLSDVFQFNQVLVHFKSPLGWFKSWAVS